MTIRGNVNLDIREFGLAIDFLYSHKGPATAYRGRSQKSNGEQRAHGAFDERLLSTWIESFIMESADATIRCFSV
jgi:hypothetical protein